MLGVTPWIAVFAASYAYIGLKAAMQTAVAHGRYAAVIPVGGGLAACEFLVIVNISRGEPWVILPVWLGSSLGCLTAMWVLRHWRVKV